MQGKSAEMVYTYTYVPDQTPKPPVAADAGFAAPSSARSTESKGYILRASATGRSLVSTVRARWVCTRDSSEVVFGPSLIEGELSTNKIVQYQSYYLAALGEHYHTFVLGNHAKGLLRIYLTNTPPSRT